MELSNFTAVAAVIGAIAAVIGATTGVVNYLAMRRKALEESRPELEPTEWHRPEIHDFDEADFTCPGEAFGGAYEIICFKKLKNSGKGSAYNVEAQMCIKNTASGLDAIALIRQQITHSFHRNNFFPSIRPGDTIDLNTSAFFSTL